MLAECRVVSKWLQWGGGACGSEDPCSACSGGCSGDCVPAFLRRAFPSDHLISQNILNIFKKQQKHSSRLYCVIIEVSFCPCHPSSLAMNGRVMSYFHRNLETVGQVVREGFLEGTPWMEEQGLAAVWLGKCS